MPKSEIVVKRAVQAYEKYLKEIKDKLIKAFVKKGADKEAAEGLTNQVMSDFGFYNTSNYRGYWPNL